MDSQTFFSALAILMSTTTALWVFFYQKNNDKKNTCLSLFQIWCSSDMYAHRRAVYLWIENHPPGNKTHGFSRNEMDQHDHTVSNSVGIVSHFVADVNTLISEDMIDRRLARRLFWDTAMKDWIEQFEAAYCSGNFDNRKDYVDWYIQYVRPIKRNMESIY